MKKLHHMHWVWLTFASIF